MKKRMITDAAMTVMLPFLMAYSLVSETLHEFGGLLMFALFIAHHILNRGWFKSLFKGRYTPVRTVNTVLDVLLLADMVCMMASAVMISKHALVFLGVRGFASIGRTLHMLGAYWGFVLMSLHLGFHGSVIAGRLGILKKPGLCKGLRIFFGAVSIYGIWAFAKRSLASYLFLTQRFVFFDMDEPVILFLLDYLSVMVLLAVLAYYGMAALKLSGRAAKKNTAGALQEAGKETIVRSGAGASEEKAAQNGTDGAEEDQRDPDGVSAECTGAAGKRRRKKRRRIILGVLGAMLIAAALIWGIPYVRRHFVTVRIDRAQAAAIGPVEFPGKTLVVYFTRTGNTNFDPDVDATSSASLMLDENGQLVGNAELIAEMAGSATGGDLYAVRVAAENRYPSSYGGTVSVAGDEKDNDIKPVLDLSAGLPQISDYDNIIMVYPIWWWTVPKAVEAFLEQTDFSGKEVCLIVTHGGSGAGDCPKDMLPMLKGGTINENVLTVYDDDADEASDQVYAWLKSLR